LNQYFSEKSSIGSLKSNLRKNFNEINEQKNINNDEATYLLYLQQQLLFLKNLRDNFNTTKSLAVMCSLNADIIMNEEIQKKMP
jgi:hypothetical protein